MVDLRDSKSAYSGYPFIILAVMFFSTIEVGSQHLQKEMGISVIDVSLLRFGFGGIFLTAAALAKVGWRKLLEIVRNDGLRLASLGLLGTTTVSLCYHWSLTLTSSMIGGAIFSINPAIIALIFVIFRVDKLIWSRATGILLGIACVYITNIGAQAHEPEFPRYFTGNIFMLATVLAWSFYFFLARDYIKKYSGLVVSCITILGGLFGLLLFSPFTSSLGWSQSFSSFGTLTAFGWGLALYLGIFTVGLGYYWLYTGLSRTGVPNGMTIFFIKPALVALLAHFLQDQPLSTWIWAGIFLAVASIFVVGIAGRNP